jgi:hypothetical protein
MIGMGYAYKMVVIRHNGKMSSLASVVWLLNNFADGNRLRVIEIRFESLSKCAQSLTRIELRIEAWMSLRIRYF